MSLRFRCCVTSVFVRMSMTLCLAAPVVAHAIGPVRPMTPGFSGYATVLLGAVERESNLNTDLSARVESLSEVSTSDGRELLLPAFELRYSLANAQTQLYAGTPAERILNLNFGLEFGVRQRIGENKLLRMAFLPAVLDAERWADPYLVGGSRAVTDQSSSGFLIGLDHPAFTLNYAQGSAEVDDERSGSALDAVSQNALRRDGNYRAVVLETGFPVEEGVLLLPSLIHVEADLDGEAMSHSHTELKMALMFKLAKSKLILSVGGGQRSYDADNPMFGQRQSDDLLSASVIFLRDSTAWWGSPGLTMMLNHSASDANIDFLDESSTMAAVGLRWSF